MIPGTKGQSTFHLIRYVRTRYMHVMNTPIRDAPPSAFRFTLFVSRIFCRTARVQDYPLRLYACHGVPYRMNTFSVRRQRKPSVVYSSYASWLMLRLIQPSVVYTSTRRCNPYWSVRRTGRNHADEHAWLCLTSHIRVIFAAHLWYYCSMLIRVFVTVCCL